MESLRSMEAFRAWQEQQRSQLDPDQTVVTICGGTGCIAFGSPAVEKAFREELDRRGLGQTVAVKCTGCHGFCEKGPVVVILPQRVFYPNVQIADVPEIIDKTVVAG